VDFKGSIVAVITPLHHDKIDKGALQELVSWHSQEGTEAIVVVGSTGINHLLTESERQDAIQTVVDANRNLQRKMKVIAGCGTFSTHETQAMVQNAQKCGVDAVMITPPCYVRPSTEGVMAHFETLAHSTSLPLIIYNHPLRTGCPLHQEVLLRLCQRIPQIVAIKDSSPEVARISHLTRELKDRVALLCGNDDFNPAFFAQGGHGVVSVTANIFPAAMKAFTTAWQNNDAARALALHQALLPIHDQLFCEPNPCPAVYALSYLKKVHNEVRLPLLAINGGSRSALQIEKAIEETTRELGLLL
jgi:4-hydroxy-tetrahydrodipicolinate synthase